VATCPTYHQFESPNAWGTSKNDHALRGFRALINKNVHCALKAARNQDTDRYLNPAQAGFFLALTRILQQFPG